MDFYYFTSGFLIDSSCSHFQVSRKEKSNRSSEIMIKWILKWGPKSLGRRLIGNDSHK